jgi:hypothetical protein
MLVAVNSDGAPPKGEGADLPLDALHAALHRIEQLLNESGRQVGEAVERGVARLPAWQRRTRGEHRWAVSTAVVAAIGLQVLLPGAYKVHPRYVLEGVAAALLIGLVIANPTHIDRERRGLRPAGLALIAAISSANIYSAGVLVHALLYGRAGTDPTRLLVTGAQIWLTNVIVFALWYWDFDRGGPVARAHAHRTQPDFLFTQMTVPELAPENWESRFGDYLYLSFTNATAFSPTDTLPLTRWAKLLMMLQSAVSLITVALVIARAVNILK